MVIVIVCTGLPRGVRVTETPTDSKTVVSEMQTLMSEIARALVDESAAVKVEVLTENETTVLRLYVSPSDIGKVIGKQGRTARSLRTILSAASMKFQHRFSLDIVEAGRVPGAPARTFQDED